MRLNGSECPLDAIGLASRYARGEAGADLDRFELHLMGCAACQANVRTAAAILAAADFGAAPTAPRVHIRASDPALFGRRRVVSRRTIAALVGIAAVVTFVVLGRFRDTG